MKDNQRVSTGIHRGNWSMVKISTPPPFQIPCSDKTLPSFSQNSSSTKTIIVVFE